MSREYCLVQGEAGQSFPHCHFPLGFNDQHDENEA